MEVVQESKGEQGAIKEEVREKDRRKRCYEHTHTHQIKLKHSFLCMISYIVHVSAFNAAAVRIDSVKNTYCVLTALCL